LHPGIRLEPEGVVPVKAMRKSIHSKTMYYIAALTVLLALVGAIAAGCGGSSSKSNQPASGGTSTNSGTTTHKSGWG
jgi:hypothetical protein